MNKSDVYEKVTAAIIEQLENGVIPWKAQWFRGKRPINHFTGKHYSGFNSFSLQFDMGLRGWVDHRFGGFGQIKKAGGKVKKGSQSVMVMYVSEKYADPEEGEERGKLLYVKCGTRPIFHLATQTEGLDLPPLAERESEFNPVASAEMLVTGYSDAPKIEQSGAAAWYNPKQDLVNIPTMFDTTEAHYGTLFHELTHSTGHQKRLAREGIIGKNSFFSKGYGKEELVAELGAVMLCGHCGLDSVNIENHAAYVAGWLSKIKEDRSILVQAASQATKATQYILGNQ